jgi:hypothetical protein
MRNSASVFVWLLLTTYFTSFSSAQVPSLNSEPQISVDCERVDSEEYISFNRESGNVDCSITNEESKRLKFEFTWTGEFNIYAGYVGGDVDNGAEIILDSDESIKVMMLIRAEKIEPTELELNVEVVVTESEEFNGWQECQDCEPYEYETKYKTTPWAEITSSSVLESNVPGLPVGASYTDDNDVICSEDLLSDLTVDIEIGMDASTKGRESMHYRLSFDVAMWTMDSFGVPQDVNRNKTNSSIPINWEGTTSIKLDANLDATGNRSDENWRVSVGLVSQIFLDNYGGIESNYIIDSRSIWMSWCYIDSTVEDPDVMEINNGESPAKTLPSIGPIMSIVTILLAAMRRSESVGFDKQ